MQLQKLFTYAASSFHSAHKMLLSLINLVAILALAKISAATDKATSGEALHLNSYNDFMTFKYEGQPALISRNYIVNVAESASIELIDFERAGEQYFVYDNGALLGTTSQVKSDHKLFAKTPEDAVKDGRFSMGIFKLAKGSHRITFTVETPYASGSAAIRLLKDSEKLWKEHDDSQKSNDDDENYEEEENDSNSK